MALRMHASVQMACTPEYDTAKCLQCVTAVCSTGSTLPCCVSLYSPLLWLGVQSSDNILKGSVCAGAVVCSFQVHTVRCLVYVDGVFLQVVCTLLPACAAELMCVHASCDCFCCSCSRIA